MKFKLEYVSYMPNLLESGVVYFSEEFDIAVHLCACGCRSKIRTPIGPTEWSIMETNDGPSLSPSIGNWQQKCQSHYWIRRGDVIWAKKWSQEEIESGRHYEEERRRIYYEDRYHVVKASLTSKIFAWLKNLFS